MRILTVPEDTEALRKKSSPIEELNPEVIGFIDELGKTLKNQHDPEGVGLSAVQIGKPLRVFATFLPQVKSEKLKVKSYPELKIYINPEIIDHPEKKTLGEELTEKGEPFLEGCLSIPDVYGPVLRWPWVNVKYQILDIKGTILKSTVLLKLGGLAARVFQHELDHLDGILFTDHVLKQGDQLYRSIGDKLEPVEL